MSKIEVDTIDKQSGSTLTVGGPGTAVTLGSGATQTGFGRTGTVDWCTTAKTSPFTAVSGDGFFLNTTSGSITVTLPSSPSAGDIVAFKDYANTFDTNAVLLCRNGSKINGNCLNASLTTESQSVTLIYVDGTKGWQDIQDSTSDVTGTSFISATGGTITTDNNFKVHTFNSSSNFVVSSLSSVPANNEVSYVVVGGGGGGGGAGTNSNVGYAGAAGGAGGFREQKSGVDIYTASPLNGAGAITVTAATFPITVGAGGSVTSADDGSPGSVSTFSTITSAGGGKGTHGGDCLPNSAGPGGSGGGSGARGQYNDSPVARYPGGTGNTPPVSPPQGNNGGKGTYAGVTGGGGGGGATAVGSDAPYNAPTAPSKTGGGDGGAGAATLISPVGGEAGPGPSRYYAGGGGGANGFYSNSPGCIAGSGNGGIGGGGDGGSGKCETNTGVAVPTQGDAGTANTGGGGGGGQSSGPTARAGNAGGSGVVIIRYRFQ